MEQKNFDAALFGIRQQGGPSQKCRDGPWNGFAGCFFQDDPRGRSCALGLIAKKKGLDAYAIHGGNALMDAHNRSAYEAKDDADFFRLWEPRMRAIAEQCGLHYTPPSDDGFAAFKAKILAPLPVEAQTWNALSRKITLR